MNYSEALKKIYLKTIIFIVVFLLLISGYFFLLNFYSQKILNKVNEISSLKEKLIQNQMLIENQNKLKKIISSIEQKTGKELKAILFNAQQILDRDFETTKNLINDKLKQENWQIQTTSFNQEEKKLTFIFQISENDLEKFTDFIVATGLIWQANNLKLDKINNNWMVELNLQTK